MYCRKLREAANSVWINQRIAVLLSHYFVNSMDVRQMEAMADDWLSELKSYPEWTIMLACKWWISSDNPDKRKKPVPGDISERACKEMAAVRIAEKSIADFNEDEKLSAVAVELTDEQRADRVERMKAVAAEARAGCAMPSIPAQPRLSVRKGLDPKELESRTKIPMPGG